MTNTNANAGTETETEPVYGLDGAKVGLVTREGAEWAAYDLSDFEVYRGRDYTLACWTLQGRA